MKAQGGAVAGYGLKSRWLAEGNVTFSVESHPDSLPYPIVAFAPRFCSVIHSAKLRLQNRGAIFSLRMTYSGFVALKIIRGGKPPRDCKQSLRPYPATKKARGVILGRVVIGLFGRQNIKFIFLPFPAFDKASSKNQALH